MTVKHDGESVSCTKELERDVMKTLCNNCAIHTLLQQLLFNAYSTRKFATRDSLLDLLQYDNL